MSNFIDDFSHHHTRNVVIACQETWRYDLPKAFQRNLQDKYYFLHESAMDTRAKKKRGRPYGGLCLIISKDIAFVKKYSHNRCLSVLLKEENIMLNNVYLPANDTRKSAHENEELMLESLGHLETVHDTTHETTNFITVGDLNVAPSDQTRRAKAVYDFLDSHYYSNCDIGHYTPNEFSHESGRLLDRIVCSESISNNIVQVEVLKQHLNSDHYPVVGNLRTSKLADVSVQQKSELKLSWKHASEAALASYSNLTQKLCSKSLQKYNNKEISGVQLYEELVDNLEKSALNCIPKYDPAKSKKCHNIPQWRERMSSFKENVDFLLQVQFLNGGPNRCPHIIKNYLRIAKSRYRRQFRHLRREIEINIAESTTLDNCFKRLFSHPKSPTPPLIEGHSAASQPYMWGEHFKEVFKGEETPYDCQILDDIQISSPEVETFDYINLTELNEAISTIDTNKSFKRHKHWKNLHLENHAAKHCLLEVINFWTKNILSNHYHFEWDFFLSNLNVIPKRGKKDPSLMKSWRPLSIGTSENWLLEKVVLFRVSPYMGTYDCQFGYKKGHSTSHAIEIVRLIEREHDVHACILDASSAFDKISWHRIKNQLVKRKVPKCLLKILCLQLFSNKIRVCNCIIFYPRCGVKQGGILSGIIFASCNDDLVELLLEIGAGVLLSTCNGKYRFICVLIYADDIILFSRSPNGLKKLIECTFIFSNTYNDLTFNPTKSWILRLGRSRNPPVSVCGIPTSSCHDYLGVQIGKSANPQKEAACKLYANTNILLMQNRTLKRCNEQVKNTAIYCYGNVYCIENLLTVNSQLRNAHRYLTKSVHQDWVQYADLDGPNIRSRTLYVFNNLDSLEVIHRKRRNMFLIKASCHQNQLIAQVIGNLPRIT